MRILVLGSGETLRELLYFSEESIVFEVETAGWFDLAAVLPGETRQGKAFGCGTLLLWEEGTQDWLRGVTAEQVVSCGFSPQNTLTPASTEPGRSMITVQRELKRPDGSYIWPQDIPLPEFWSKLPLPQQMMLAGLRLLGAHL